MEWVETTGRTVEEAKDQALDQLGVDESDAEFEILEEPRPGLFGRMRGEARVRARVAPREQRPKQERRDRRSTGRSRKGGRASSGPSGKSGGERRSGKAADSTATDAGATDAEATDVVDAASDGADVRGDETPAAAPTDQGTPSNGATSPRADRSDRSRRGGRSGPKKGSTSTMDAEIVSVDAQAAIIKEFLDGLLDAFDADGEIVERKPDDETIELDIVGEDLGLLIGHKGQTLAALQDLSRTYLQRKATGTYEGRVRIDVSGYRQRRKEALERFARSIAEAVRDSGTAKALEAMGSADRKIVHDVVNEIEGVSTISEGQEPDRRVVVVPDAQA